MLSLVIAGCWCFRYSNPFMCPGFSVTVLNKTSLYLIHALVYRYAINMYSLLGIQQIRWMVYNVVVSALGVIHQLVKLWQCSYYWQLQWYVCEIHTVSNSLVKVDFVTILGSKKQLVLWTVMSTRCAWYLIPLVIHLP